MWFRSYGNLKFQYTCNGKSYTTYFGAFYRIGFWEVLYQPYTKVQLDRMSIVEGYMGLTAADISIVTENIDLDLNCLYYVDDVSSVYETK